MAYHNIFIHIYELRETKVEGRRRSYILTEKGEDMLRREYLRINAQVMDFEKLFGKVDM